MLKPVLKMLMAKMRSSNKTAVVHSLNLFVNPPFAFATAGSFWLRAGEKKQIKIEGKNKPDRENN